MKLLNSNHNNARAHYGLGQVNFREKNYNDALSEYKKAIQVNPNFADAYLELGRLYYFNENYGEALDAFKKYAELQPGSVEGETYIAKVLYGQRKYDEALTKLEAIIKDNPDADLSSAYKYMAYVYNDKEEYDKALDYFSKVPKNLFDIEDYIKLAQIYVNKDDFDNAYKNFNLAI